MSKKNNNVDLVIDEALDNIRKDRAMASTLLIELMKILRSDETKHQYSGPVAAKYLETLQRSNEQLVKIGTLLYKESSSKAGLSVQDREDIYNIINEN